MHPGKRADNLQMAEFLGADVHEQVLALRVLAVETLDRVLQSSSQLAVGTAKLFQEHIAEAGIGLIHPDRVHQLLHMVIHGGLGVDPMRCPTENWSNGWSPEMFRPLNQVGRRAQPRSSGSLSGGIHPC